MLLATFQPFYNDEELKRGYHLRSDGKFQAAGFQSPVWCCGAETLSDLLISTRMAAPRFPDMFILVETEDFRRVDKVRWYQYVREGKDFDESLLDPELPDVECEFLIDASILVSSFVLQFPVVLLRQILDDTKLPIIVRDKIDCFDDAVAFQCRERARKLLVKYDGYDFGIKRDLGWSKTKVDYKSEVNRARLVFIYAFMPYLWACVKGLDNPELYAHAFSFSSDVTDRVYTDFCMWAEGEDSPCDASEFKVLLKRFENCIIDNEGFLSYLLEHGNLPNVNESCPCGSGRKFKKCCKRKYFD